jgi:GNAT superfamily N-acetyltransferase
VSVQIRSKRDSDAAACVRLVREVHDADSYPRYLPADPATFINPPYETAAWVAEQDEVLVGHVALHAAEGDPTLPAAQRATGLPAKALAVVARLLVAPSARRQGLGQALLAHAVTQARASGQRAVLDVTRDAAVPIALYEADGWSRLEPLTMVFDDGTSLAMWVYLSPEAGDADRSVRGDDRS